MRGIFGSLSLLGLIAIAVGIFYPYLNAQATRELQSELNVYWGGVAAGGVAALCTGLLGMVLDSLVSATNRVADEVARTAAADAPVRRPVIAPGPP